MTSSPRNDAPADRRAADDAPADRRRALPGLIRRSFIASVGSIVFGMEDGTVSIFGLVFGVAFSAPNSHAVLLAGATGAVAAAVSMMAGTFLDVQSTNDQAAARLAEERARFDANRGQQDRAIQRRLVSAGFSDSDAETVVAIVGKHPETGVKIAAAVDLARVTLHLRADLIEYQEHYNTARPNQGIGQHVPGADPGPRVTAADPGTWQIRRKPVLSGLINEYERTA